MKPRQNSDNIVTRCYVSLVVAVVFKHIRFWWQLGAYTWKVQYLGMLDHAVAGNPKLGPRTMNRICDETQDMDARKRAVVNATCETTTWPRESSVSRGATQTQLGQYEQKLWVWPFCTTGADTSGVGGSRDAKVVKKIILKVAPPKRRSSSTTEQSGAADVGLKHAQGTRSSQRERRSSRRQNTD